jgi:hypothetical protein
MSNKKQTAVEWLKSEMLKPNLSMKDILEQAKEMEKQQIIEAHLDGQSLVSCKDEYAEQYYNENYEI